jgi:5-methylcytosine-specific restriction endonuclease McrA
MPQGYKKDGTKLIPPKMGGWNKGKKRYWDSPTEIKKGQHISPRTEFKKGEMSERQRGEKNSDWKGGVSLPKDCIDCGVGLKHGYNKRCGRCSDKFTRGENHPNWQGGKSFEPYGIEFNEDLKEVIRNRDRRKCFICEKTELEIGEKLSIHHIDYEKQNNNPNNLITLCRGCHAKTNFSRNKWTSYFKNEKVI